MRRHGIGLAAALVMLACHAAGGNRDDGGLADDDRDAGAGGDAAAADAVVLLSGGKPVVSLHSVGPAFEQPASQLTDGSDATPAYPGDFVFDYEVHLENNYPIRSVALHFGSFAAPEYIDSWSLMAVSDTGAVETLASGGVPPGPVVTLDLEQTVHKLRITASSQTNWIGVYELEVFGIDRPGLEYLGYYGVPSVAELAQMRGNANLAQVDAADFARIQAAGDNGMQAWVSNIYFGFLHGSCTALRADLSAWDLYASQLEPLLPLVKVIYLVDEPYGNLESGAYQCTRAQIRARLDDAATLVKQRFASSKPDLVIAVVEDPRVIEPDVLFPASIDWVGFDCYPGLHGGTFDACGSAGQPIGAYVDALAAKLTPDQRIVIVPEGFHYDPGNVPPTSDKQAAVAALARRYLDVALSRPAVVAVMPFVGPHQVYGDDIFFGVFEMPPVHDIYRRFGETMNPR